MAEEAPPQPTLPTGHFRHRFSELGALQGLHKVTSRTQLLVRLQIRNQRQPSQNLSRFVVQTLNNLLKNSNLSVDNCITFMSARVELQWIPIDENRFFMDPIDENRLARIPSMRFDFPSMGIHYL